MAESSPARRVEWPRRSPAAATRAKAGSEPRHQAGAPLNTASRRAFASDIPHVSFSKSECVAALVYTYHHHVRERRTLHRRNHSANTIVKTALTGRLRLPSSDSACSSRSIDRTSMCSTRSYDTCHKATKYCGRRCQVSRSATSLLGRLAQSCFGKQRSHLIHR